jgi:hypothetical protein
LDQLLHLFCYRFVLDYWLLDYALHLFYTVSVDDLLHDYLHLDWFLYDAVYLHDFLYYLRHFNDLLHRLDYWHYLLNYSVNWLITNLYVVSDVWSRDIFYSLYDLLYKFLNLDNFRHFYSNLYYLFNNLVDRN